MAHRPRIEADFAHESEFLNACAADHRPRNDLIATGRAIVARLGVKHPRLEKQVSTADDNRSKEHEARLFVGKQCTPPGSKDWHQLHQNYIHYHRGGAG